MAKKDKKNNAASTTVDFTGVSKGTGGKWVKRLPEGEFFPFKVKEIKREESSNGNPMLTMVFIGQSGKVRDRQTRDRFVLLPNSLWKLRQLLEAMGIDVPEKKINIPHDKLINGPTVGISFLDDEYDGKTTSKPDEYCSEDEITDGDDGVDEDIANKKAKKGKKSKKNDDSLEDLDLESI